MENLVIENINSRIFTIRGEKVMIDNDLAEIYQVEVKRINEQVRRNMERFPSDFMFQLTDEEEKSLRSQNATLKNSKESLRGKHRKYNSFAFTEQGVYMLATVLKSKVATEVTLTIMRTFTTLRRYALTYEDLAKKINEIESRVTQGEQTDQKIIEVLNQLMAKDDTTIGKIGFVK